MGEMRKQFCICGWNKIIVEMEYRPFDKRIGGKDILLCAECVAGREAGSPEFQENYAAATKGTHASVTDTRVVLVKKEQTPDDRTDALAKGLVARARAAASTINNHQRTTVDVVRAFLRGALFGFVMTTVGFLALIHGLFGWP